MIDSLGTEGSPLWITVDSGAPENAVSEELNLGVPTVPSKRSAEGIQYIAANGGSMPNHGEKAVKVMVGEGHRCLLRVQVTDVKKPLLSVARICDAGHTVTLRPEGGNIRHVGTG